MNQIIDTRRSLVSSHSLDPTMENVLERFVAPGTQRRDEAPPVVRRDVRFTHSSVRSEDHSERTGLEVNERGERYISNCSLSLKRFLL